MFVLKGILRAESQEKILLYLLHRESGYASNIAEFFRVPLTPVQKQLKRLEDDGVLVSFPIGRVRNYQLNPRYAFSKELRELLIAATKAYPQDLMKELMIERKRPRKQGKEIEYARPRALS